MCIIRIARYPNVIDAFASLSFKNKARKVNKELLKGKYLGTLIGVRYVKYKDSKVLSDCGMVEWYHKVGYYFALGADNANNIFLLTFAVNSLSSSMKKVEVFIFK